MSGSSDSSEGTKIAVLDTKFDYIKDELAKINAKLESNYVTQDQFEPIQRIVYGMVGVILFSVISGLLFLILNKPS